MKYLTQRTYQQAMRGLESIDNIDYYISIVNRIFGSGRASTVRSVLFQKIIEECFEKGEHGENREPGWGSLIYLNSIEICIELLSEKETLILVRTLADKYRDRTHINDRLAPFYIATILISIIQKKMSIEIWRDRSGADFIEESIKLLDGITDWNEKTPKGWGKNFYKRAREIISSDIHHMCLQPESFITLQGVIGGVIDTDNNSYRNTLLVKEILYSRIKQMSPAEQLRTLRSLSVPERRED